MFKTELPHNCPPRDVSERGISLFRLVIPSNNAESFKNHVELFPDRNDLKNHCKANGLSFFDNIEALLPLLEKDINYDKKIARVTITEDLGKVSNTPTKSGHYTLWLYKSADIEKIEMELIELDV